MPTETDPLLPKGFLRPCLLLLLREEPAHGYDLLERVQSLGIDGSDPGGLYRAALAGEGEARALVLGTVRDRPRPPHLRDHPRRNGGAPSSAKAIAAGHGSVAIPEPLPGVRRLAVEQRVPGARALPSAEDHGRRQGRVGKTTISALLARELASAGADTLAVDCDPNPTLGGGARCRLRLTPSFRRDGLRPADGTLELAREPDLIEIDAHLKLLGGPPSDTPLADAVARESPESSSPTDSTSASPTSARAPSSPGSRSAVCSTQPTSASSSATVGPSRS